MSIKSFIFVLITVIILMAVAFFTGRWSKPAPEKPEKKNAGVAVFVKSDTAVVTKELKIKSAQSKKAEKVFGDTVYTAEFDSLFTMDKDSIRTKTKVKFNVANTEFTIDQDIKYRKYERMITDTITVEKTLVQKVEISPPFYNTFTFGFLSGIILFLVGAIFW